MVTLPPRELSAASALVGRAFAADPFANHAIPGAQGRDRRLATIFRAVVAGALRYGEVDATSPELIGVAAWLRPGNEILSMAQLIRCGVLRIPLKLPWAVTREYRRYEVFAEALHRKVAPEPHWYLAPLAVEPEHQGAGHGSMLLQVGLDRIDREGKSCFLETQNERNISLYERHGFDVVEQTVVPGTRLGHWCMLRPAKT